MKTLRTFGVTASIVLAVATVARAQTEIPTWQSVFDPLQVLTLNLELSDADWTTVVNDTTNSIEVPARFWADGEAPILVSVRRKSSRPLGPKVGLKVDINDLVDGQKWRGLTKLSLENGADAGVVAEGVAWNLHRLAADAFGFQSAYAAFVQLRVNGQPLGVYLNAEQHDKQMLRNRGLWKNGETWIYDQSDINAPEREEGVGDSPAYRALCYSPFQVARGKEGLCATPSDATLQSQLPQRINMDRMLTQGALDAYMDNPDALFTHGKNFHFVDFSDPNNTGKDTRRLYFPWDLDAVFRSTSANIYASGTGRRTTASAYQAVILRNAAFRQRYNEIFLNLLNGPLAVGNVQFLLTQMEAAVSEALAADPYPSGEGSGGDQFARLRAWVAERDRNVRIQIEANNSPAPR